MSKSPEKITLERTYKAPLKDVWELWTTQKGFESWWGPGGFAAKVKNMDLRPGGDLEYSMIAVQPEQIEFMKKAGLPLSTDAKLTFVKIEPMKKLSYSHWVDFVPNVKPYKVETVVEMQETKQGVRMIVTMESMHDSEWTQRSVAGMESQLEKLTSRFSL